MIRASCTLALLLAVATTAAGQVVGGAGVPRPGAAEEKPAVTGTARVKGRVVSAATGQPLRRAQVRLSAPERGTTQPLTTGTDIDGYYEVSDLPAGRYSISVSRSGHLPTQHGQRHPGETGSPLQLRDGEEATINFALQRAGRITGRVTDETGEPVAEIPVYVLQQEYFQGRRRLVLAANQSGLPGRTDESGQFRVHGLLPGRYYLMASSRETWTSDDDPRITYGHTSSYYPGVRSPAAAQPVRVGPGQVVEAIDFSLVAARTVTLSGTAFGPDGQPLSGATVMLTQELQGPTSGSMMSLNQTSVSGSGAWIIEKVPPGEFTVRVSGRSADGRQQTGHTPVVVDESDIEGIVVISDPGAVIAGDVVVEGGLALPPKLRVMTSPPQGSGMGTFLAPGAEDGLVDENGRFARRGASGPVLVTLTGLPPGWSIKSVEVRGEDHVTTPVELDRGGRLEGVRIVLTTRFPNVTGTVTDERGLAAEATVLLFPADESKWFESQASQRTTRPDQSGMYRFSSVRPGEYLAIALETLEPGQSRDPEFLESLRGRATTVRLQEGEDRGLNLKVQR